MKVKLVRGGANVSRKNDEAIKECSFPLFYVQSFRVILWILFT